MGLISSIERGYKYMREILPSSGAAKKAAKVVTQPFKAESSATAKVDSFVHVADNAVPSKLQKALDLVGPYERDKQQFLKELYSTGSNKFDFIYNHKYFNGGMPYFNDKEFISAIKKMSEKEIKQTFDDVTKLYESLPKEGVEYNQATKEIIYKAQTPRATNIAQLTILRANNKEAYDYILKNPNKEAVSSLLSNFDYRINGSALETLTIPQIRQMQGLGQASRLHFPEDRKIIMEGNAALTRYVEYSDMFCQQPEDVARLSKYLSKSTITEPFTAFRAEKDTGMFSSIILDKSMARKVKFIALKNMFKAKKVKVHEYNGTFDNFNHTNLFSHIMNSKELTLADAMQVAKYGGKKYQEQIADLIKNSQVKDNRFKSLTFDSTFARQWAETQDGHTKILHNMSVDSGLNGAYSGVNNRQAEFILNNDDKVMRFQNVIYDPKRDIFCLDTSVSVK